MLLATLNWMPLTSVAVPAELVPSPQLMVIGVYDAAGSAPLLSKKVATIVPAGTALPAVVFSERTETVRGDWVIVAVGERVTVLPGLSSSEMVTVMLNGEPAALPYVLLPETRKIAFGFAPEVVPTRVMVPGVVPLPQAIDALKSAGVAKGLASRKVPSGTLFRSWPSAPETLIVVLLLRGASATEKAAVVPVTVCPPRSVTVILI